MDLKDKVAVVTGAGRGAGRSIALALAVEGAQLVLASRTVSELESARDQVKALGSDVVAVPTDLSNPQQVQNLARETLAAFQTVDVIVNNAGWCPPLRLVQDTTIEDWDLAMKINVRGPFLLVKALLPTMLAKRFGHVINISSDVARGDVRQQVPTAYPRQPWWLSEKPSWMRWPSSASASATCCLAR